MPESWRPTGRVHEELSQAPWSAAEGQDASRAVHKGLDELIAFFETRPASVHSLWENAVQCFLDIYLSRHAIFHHVTSHTTEM